MYSASSVMIYHYGKLIMQERDWDLLSSSEVKCDLYNTKKITFHLLHVKVSSSSRCSRTYWWMLQLRVHIVIVREICGISFQEAKTLNHEDINNRSALVCLSPLFGPNPSSPSLLYPLDVLRPSFYITLDLRDQSLLLQTPFAYVKNVYTRRHIWRQKPSWCICGSCNVFPGPSM